jgi:Sugar (and other) transporter
MVTTTKIQKNVYTFLVQSVWPGLGLLGESYLLFSLGTLQPLLATVGVVPLVIPLILGVICGMIGFGVAGSTGISGRRGGSICTAALMWVGSLGMFWTSLAVQHHNDDDVDGSNNNNNALFGTSLCLLGLGVGGEYPMAAASASEQQQVHNADGGEHHHRGGGGGRQVQLVFSMQGMGILLHCILLWALLMIFGDEEEASLLLVWRILYFVGVLLLSTVLITRVLLLKESPVWEADRKRATAAAAAAEMVELPGNRRSPPQSPSPSSDYYPGRNKQQQQLDPTSSPAAAGLNHHSVKKTTTTIENNNITNMAAPYPLIHTVSSLSVPSVAIAVDGTAVYHIHTEQEQRPPSSSSTSTGASNNHYEWRLAWKLYGARLVGVSLSWFFWDVAFYGNKLFQSAFLLALTGAETTTLTQGAAAATLNAGVAAAGYLTAAAVMDRIGHWRLQSIGFVVTGLLFLSTGFFLDRLDGAKVGLVILYLGTSFFGQVGPNATTFVLPAEVMPTAWRTLGHGLAAASGKLGALLATLLFHSHGGSNQNDDDENENDKNNNNTAANLFLWSGYASLLGAVITYWLVPYETAPNGGTTTHHGHDGHKIQASTPPPPEDYSSFLDTNWHKAASGQPYVVPADSVYERLRAQRRKAHADGHYLTSDIHDAVFD